MKWSKKKKNREDINNNKKYRPTSLLIIDAKILNEMSAN